MLVHVKAVASVHDAVRIKFVFWDVVRPAVWDQEPEVDENVITELLVVFEEAVGVGQTVQTSEIQE